MNKDDYPYMTFKGDEKMSIEPIFVNCTFDQATIDNFGKAIKDLLGHKKARGDILSEKAIAD